MCLSAQIRLFTIAKKQHLPILDAVRKKVLARQPKVRTVAPYLLLIIFSHLVAPYTDPVPN
jgi:hypothetical protein